MVVDLWIWYRGPIWVLIDIIDCSHILCMYTWHLNNIISKIIPSHNEINSGTFHNLSVTRICWKNTINWIKHKHYGLCVQLLLFLVSSILDYQWFLDYIDHSRKVSPTNEGHGPYSIWTHGGFVVKSSDWRQYRPIDHWINRSKIWFLVK